MQGVFFLSGLPPSPRGGAECERIPHFPFLESSVLHTEARSARETLEISSHFCQNEFYPCVKGTYTTSTPLMMSGVEVVI